MVDQSEVLDDAAELAARWHATVEAHIAGQLGECAHRLAEAELKEEGPGRALDRCLAHHLAHALMVATSMDGIGSAVQYLHQVTGLLLEAQRGTAEVTLAVPCPGSVCYGRPMRARNGAYSRRPSKSRSRCTCRSHTETTG